MSGVSRPRKSQMRAPRPAVLGVLACLSILPVFSAGGTESSGPGLQITYSKNIEIFSILANLTPIWEKTKPNSGFAEESRGRFLSFQAHEAVGRTENLLRKRNRQFLVHVAVHLTDFPEARLLYPSLSFFAGRLLSGTVSAVRRFCADSSFEDYWEDKTPVYEQWKSRLEDKVRGVTVADALEKFFGMKKDRYWLVLTPQTAHFRMWRTLDRDGKRDGLVVFGPWPEKADGCDFIPARNLVIDVALREFSRMFISSVMDGREGLLKRYARIQKKALKSGLIPGIDKSWRNFLLENLAASIQARLAGRLYGKTVESEVLEQHALDGYVLVPIIDGLIGDYEMNRGKYPAFAEFLPALLDGLDKRMGSR